MSDPVTFDNFSPPTPEQLARRNALAEIKEEVGVLKTKLRTELRALKRKRAEALIPSAIASLDGQIAAKQKEFDDVDCLFSQPITDADKALQNHVRGLIKWDEIMRKHGVCGN